MKTTLWLLNRLLVFVYSESTLAISQLLPWRALSQCHPWGKLRHGWRNMVPSWITHALVLVLKPLGQPLKINNSLVISRLSPKPPWSCTGKVPIPVVMAGARPGCCGPGGVIGGHWAPRVSPCRGGSCPAGKHSPKGSSALLQPHEPCGEIDVVPEQPSAACPAAGCVSPVLNE